MIPLLPDKTKRRICQKWALHFSNPTKKIVAAAGPGQLFFAFCLGGSPLFQCSLGRRQPGNRHTEWRTAHIGQAKTMTKFYADRLAPMFPANAELDVRPGFAAQFASDLH